MKDLTISAYLDATASTEAATPGGGSAAALCGALASALTAMVARLTAGRNKDAADDARLREIIENMRCTRDLFTGYMQEDADAYTLVKQARSMPGDTEALQSALKLATDTPMKVAETAARITSAIRDAANLGNQAAISDAALAMMLARTCALGAILNARANLARLDDPAYAEATRRRCSQIETGVAAAEQSLLASLDI